MNILLPNRGDRVIMRGKLKFSFLLILSVLLLGCTKSTKEIESRKENTNDNITDISNKTANEIEDVVLCQYFGHKKSNFFMLHF